MSKKNKKYYVVWEGLKPGIYETWAECQKQTKGYSGARFRSFSNYEEALKAYEENDFKTKDSKTNEKYIEESICVDAASSGNPGVMEFRGIDLKTSEQIFHFGPYSLGTNNIGEFLAIVEALKYIQINELDKVIYTDSVTALAWVRDKKVSSKLVKNEETRTLWWEIEQAINWLKNNHYETKLLKWDTNSLGEIPADFGRKSSR